MKQAYLTTRDEVPINKSRARCLQILLPLSTTFNIIACCSSFGFLIGDSHLDQLWGSLHYLCFVVGMFVNIVHSHTITRPLHAQLAASLEFVKQGVHGSGPTDKTIQKAMALMERLDRQYKTNASFIWIVNLLMGSVPFLLRKASYQMPIAWTFIEIGIMDVLTTTRVTHDVDVSSSNTGSRNANPAEGGTSKESTVSNMKVTPHANASEVSLQA